MNNHYVYLYMREDLYSPWYVGSGTGYRCYIECSVDRKPPKDRNLIRKVYEGTEKECRELEGLLILFYGIKEEGVLENQRYETGGLPYLIEWCNNRHKILVKNWFKNNKEYVVEQQKEKYLKRKERDGNYWEKGNKEEFNRKQRERYRKRKESGYVRDNKEYQKQYRQKKKGVVE